LSSTQLERPLPQAFESERVLLGVFLVDSEKNAHLLNDLRDTDFFDTRHRLIFQALRALAEKGNGCDLLLLDDELRRTGRIADAGGTPYIAGLANLTPAGLNIEGNLRLVRDSAMRRRLLFTFHDLSQLVFDRQLTSAELLDHAGERVSDHVREIVESADVGITWRDAAAKLLSSLEERNGIRVLTGISKLDLSTGGFRAGELIVVCAETGVGKTLFAQQLRRRACADAWHGLFASGEMSAAQLTARELAIEAEVAAWKLRQPERLNQEEWARLVKSAAGECAVCRVLDGELSVSRIRQAARRMKKTDCDLGLVVLDYDELIEAEGETEFEQQQALARSAKSIAVELALPVVLISQLRKPISGEEATRPTLARLYGSSAKAKHASSVIYIDRPFVRKLSGDEVAANLFLLKNRFGPAGKIPVRFDLRNLRFVDAAEEGSKKSQSQTELWVGH
jgi:replicative DNA helicase